MVFLYNAKRDFKKEIIEDMEGVMTKILLKIVIGLNKIVRKLNNIMDNHNNGLPIK